MMDRRKALTMGGKAMALGVGWLSFGQTGMLAAGVEHDESSAKFAEGAETFDERFLADMKRMGTRTYSEEGIPMLLACEDLTITKPSTYKPTAQNVAVATAFHKYVEAWQKAKPDAPATDVPKLLELLAVRDFSDGGKDANLL